MELTKFTLINILADFNFILLVLLAYLLGSINGSLVLGRFKQVDIRTQGSGNAGGTNALRTQGFWFALGVIIIDVGKAIVVVIVLPIMIVKFGLINEFNDRIIICAAAAVIFGHCYPIWHGFKGGKGAATFIGVLLALDPVLVLFVLIIFFSLLIISGYVGPNTVIASISAAAIYAIKTTGFIHQDMFWFLLIMGLFIAFTHRNNINKFFQGKESRFEKVRLFHRFFFKQ